MAEYNPDVLFEKVVMKTSMIWGPVYALYYLARFVWAELVTDRKNIE